MPETRDSEFSGWAVLELFGHTKEVGFVRTAYFGGSAMFRVDVPELPEREHTLTEPEYVAGQYVSAGATVRREAVPARTRYVGVSSVFALNPCTEEVARQVLERSSHRWAILVGENAALPASGEEDISFCDECGLATCDCSAFVNVDDEEGE